MTTVLIDARCTACGLCIVTCPERALAKAPRRPLTYDDRCTACLACIEVCPVDAIDVRPSSSWPSGRANPHGSAGLRGQNGGLS